MRSNSQLTKNKFNQYKAFIKLSISIRKNSKNMMSTNLLSLLLSMSLKNPCLKKSEKNFKLKNQTKIEHKKLKSYSNNLLPFSNISPNNKKF